MTATPEPMSSAPDTEALRPLIEAAVRQGIKDWDRDYDSRATGPITNYVLGALDYALRTREAGLRAGLDRARADIERLTAEMLMVPRANDTVIAQVVEAVLAAGDWNGGIDAARRVFRERAELARVSGDRTIPDDAAVDVAARWLLRAGLHVDAVDTKARADRMWQRDLDEEDREAWRVLARDLLADLGGTPTTVGASAGTSNETDRSVGATPTTGPAPAAADGPFATDAHVGARPWDLFRRSDLQYVCVCGDLVPTAAQHFRGRWTCLPQDHSAQPPAAPQAPAEPTEDAVLLAVAEDRMRRDTGERHPLDEVLSDLSGLAAREDTAPPDAMGHRVHVQHDAHGAIARCLHCDDFAAGTDRNEIDDWASKHSADTLRPTGPLTPIQSEEV